MSERSAGVGTASVGPLGHDPDDPDDTGDTVAGDAPTVSEMVASISQQLSGGLDMRANVAEIARVVVPLLATWSIVSTVDEDGTVHDVGSWHADPALRETVASYSRARQDGYVDETFVAAASRTREPIFLTGDAHAEIRSRMRPGDAREVLDRLRPDFVAVLPMVLRGRTVGVLTFFPDAEWTSARRRVADDVVARAALMIDNSQAYERERDARTKAEAAERRLSLLAQADELLVGSSDPDRAMGELARLVVPALADWAFVTVLQEDGSIRDVGIAHRDPAKFDDLAAYSRVHLETMSDDAAVSRVLRTGAPVVVPKLREEILTSFLPDPHVAELTRRLAPHGVASFPLAARGRTLGALTLATTAERGPHKDEEVALGLEIARRAGPVLDAARAAHQARSLVESMQTAMLETAAPRADLGVATRYRAASHDREIGGDWYDLFELPNGSTLVSIGDAMGHDVQAIASMAQLRTLLRAVAWTADRSPARILSAVDDVNLGLGPTSFATALVAEIGAADQDGSVEVRWSSAGHLPPVFVLPDGSARLLDDARADLALGVSRRVDRHDQVIRLPAGSTLLLYTDGLIERRDRDLDDGLRTLVKTMGRLDLDDVDAALDSLLFALIGDMARFDDTALLAVRIGDSATGHPSPSVVRASLALPPTLEAPSAARDFVLAHCAGLPPAVVGDALVLTSELVTNAVRYGRPERLLELAITRDTLRVTVNDDGPELLVLHTGAPDPSSPGGRGLLIVAALATAWGVRHVDGSDAKSVWFELALRR